MKKLRIRFLRFFAFVALLGTVSIVTDLHADEYKHKQTHTCCVTCCPAHNLAPSSSSVRIFTSAGSIRHQVPLISCMSADVFASIFHPPQSAV